MLGEGAVLGGYVLERRVAIGGMAEIWAAVRPGAARFCAVKVLLESFTRDEKLRRMFLDEARIATLLAHPNVVRVEEVIEDGEQLALVMELVDGRDLRRVLQAVIKAGARVPVPIALLVARDAARGLAYAHGLAGPDGRPLHIVHRDVSPHNVMIDRGGRVRVVDFGVARAENRSAETSAGVVKGKLGYMAPEQLLGGAVTVQADVWGLGVLLWEMLALRRLFVGAADADVVGMVVGGQVPSLEIAHRDDLPEALEALVRAMLAIDPAKRPRSMLEVEAALTELGRRYGADFGAGALAAWVAGHLDPAKRKTASLELPVQTGPEDAPTEAFDDATRDADELADTSPVAAPTAAERAAFERDRTDPVSLLDKTDPVPVVGKGHVDPEPDEEPATPISSVAGLSGDELAVALAETLPSSRKLVPIPLPAPARATTPAPEPASGSSTAPLPARGLEPAPLAERTAREGGVLWWVLGGLLSGAAGIALLGRACGAL